MTTDQQLPGEPTGEPTAELSGAPTGVPAADVVSSGPVTVSRVSRARTRPTGTRKELFVWYMMRVTGVALFVLALGHFSVLHFIWDPAEQTAEWITNERWSQIFWRLFDWLLLMTVLFHGFLGMRTVVLDYIHRPGLRTGTLWLLYLTAVILFIIGTQVIVTLPMAD